ncbi:hypothetical protein BGZ65_002153 [Modicella reniformis]|uniref:Uncharacterized protein n=1 Tax=Modicella reniformis TaxID=1440133 RepID=A0A9P6LSW2_9FUNG|nr:hypothetical protein BGZ65_002153 [Modicella reniformis]
MSSSSPGSNKLIFLSPYPITPTRHKPIANDNVNDVLFYLRGHHLVVNLHPDPTSATQLISTLNQEKLAEFFIQYTLDDRQESPAIPPDTYLLGHFMSKISTSIY